MCLILTVCCLTPPPFRRPSCLLFIFFLFFQDGLALITFTIEQPGSPHSRPGFPPSLCYICQAHGLSFAWTFSSSSMWPRTSTNRAGNNLEGIILLVNLLTSVHAEIHGPSHQVLVLSEEGSVVHDLVISQVLPGALELGCRRYLVFLESTWTVDPRDWTSSNIVPLDLDLCLSLSSDQ